MRLTNLRGWRLATAGACVIALGASVAAQTMQLIARGRRSRTHLLEVVGGQTKYKPNVQINYNSIGSGGIRQLQNQTVFFGATDGPMTNDQLAAARDASCTSPPSWARSCRFTTSRVWRLN